MKQGNSGGFPTVLVAELDGVLPTLANDLRNAGYNILEAHDWQSAVQFIIAHSRPIHVLLTNVKTIGVDAAELLKFRPGMQVLFISQTPISIRNDVLDPASALTTVKDVLRSHSTSGIINTRSRSTSN